MNARLLMFQCIMKVARRGGDALLEPTWIEEEQRSTRASSRTTENVDLTSVGVDPNKIRLHEGAWLAQRNPDCQPTYRKAPGSIQISFVADVFGKHNFGKVHVLTRELLAANAPNRISFK